jgi:RHS repeat-associated protein
LSVGCSPLVLSTSNSAADNTNLKQYRRWRRNKLKSATRRVHFGQTGYKTSETFALNLPEQQTYTYTYYADNLLQSVTDALGRVTSYNYDANGNVTSITRLSGTSNPVTTTMTYDSTFNQLLTVTDPLNHTTQFGYDTSGNLLTVTDPLQHQTTLTHDAEGRVVSSTDPMSDKTTFNYFLADLATVTDPLSRTTMRSTDPAGRVVSVTDPMGHVTKMSYNALDQVTSTTDAMGNITTFTFDPNGNLLTVTDANQHTTTYTYNNMDQVQTRQDALTRQETYTYDLNGNLSTFTDRRGKLTIYTYDGLNRKASAGFGAVVNGGNTTYDSTIIYTYDSGNRLTRAVDSIAGAITRGYDLLDNMSPETTPQGSISYTYDNANRRKTMTVTGQPQLTYTYDDADRLYQILQGSSTVGLAYDNANRRTSLTLPNGVVTSYNYDSASELTGLTYQVGTNTLGNLTYAYDVAGRRTQVGGSFARTGLPAAITSASYDVANELTNWNGTALSYDSNGNMLSDGSNSFTWNARNQVAALNGVSMQYDGFGRRATNAAGTSFLYDGANATQELSGSTVLANLATGGIDEVFSRSDASGAFAPLKDALGSAIALAGSTGTIQTSYTYDPFGGTSVSGGTSANKFQYTGRENDGNGLYYYRARYYSPTLARFISEDPIGFASGQANLYGYVFNSPTNLVDPSGLVQCTYSISAHTLSCFSNDHMDTWSTSNARSGYGNCMNDQACAGIPNVGPIPPWNYTLGPVGDTPNPHDPARIPIHPAKNYPYDRSGFEIHPGLSQTSSRGCIALGSRQNYEEFVSFYQQDRGGPNTVEVVP